MSGIAAFINGGVQGVNMRHSWDDRKRRQKLEDERMGWSREDREYTVSERERLTAERERLAAAAANERSVFQGAVDATNAAMDGQGDPMPQPELGIIPQDAPIAETPLPAIGLEQSGAPTDSPEALAADAAGALGQVAPASPRERGVTRDYSTGELVYPPGTGPDANVAEQGPQAEQQAAAAEGYQLIQEGLPDNGRIYRHAETGQLAFASEGRSTNDQAEIEQMLAQPQAKDGGSIAGPQGAPQGTDAPQSSEPPSAQIATAVVAQEQERSVAPNGNANTPLDVQRDRATRSFMQNYMEVGAPQVIEYYLSTGNIEAARQYDAWIKQDQVQEGMEAYSHAVFAASVGDEDGFLDSLADAYNVRGYFDDNVTVNRAESGFTRDDAGNITGATLSFTDGDTGKTFTQKFDDPNDIIRAGLSIMSPEKVFEEGQRAVASADTARAAQAKHEQSMELQLLKNSGSSSGRGETDTELFDTAREELMGDGILSGATKMIDGVDTPFNDWPQEDQNAAISALVNQRKQGIASLGSVAGNGPPPVWRGE